MSRSDLRHADFDYSIYADGRDFHVPVHNHHPRAGAGQIMHANKASIAMRSYRDSMPRDYAPPRESMQNTAYYQSPLPQIGINNMSTGSDRDEGRRGDIGGYSAGMGPPQRMYGSVPAPPPRIVTNSEGWNPAGPPVGRQAPGGVAVNSGGPQVQGPGAQHPLLLNHHHRSSPPRPPAPFSPPNVQQLPYAVDRDRDAIRDAYYTSARHSSQHSQQQSISSPQSLGQPTASSPTSSQQPRSTLWWGELEPWMDEEYAKQVCNLMGWDPVNIKVPRPAPEAASGRQAANNPGYCFLTFPTQTHAASVLAQINNANNSMTMPNSSRPFNLNWASSVPNAPLNGAFPATTISIPGAQNPQYPKEYSIFVGDLAPEVSNSDLVAVFRNPVLGLRNDREPRFIRPFLSCKSAKIMLDPVTGVSRGYGFVRFTDEPDQQRALIEMHGLYCLSRPMRISPATAKFKSAPGLPGMDMPSMYGGMGPQAPASADQVTIALPLPSTNQTKSVSTPLATTSGTTSSSGSNASLNTTNSGSSLNGAPTSMSSSSTLASAASDETSTNTAVPHSPNLAPAANNSQAGSITADLSQQLQDQIMAQRFNLSEESWKHHAQARAILSNLIGPNGEQLTSSDPYNTTVFVGGLSPLISEETLRTFFVPFGDIHYVKVPVGKHCGFVQFVRKPDAERAIEKMQGFPIGGSRIRLSWGRSQYKAAQAAAQAAQAAAFQAQYQLPQPAPSASPLTAEQAMQLLEKFGIAQFLNNTTLPDGEASSVPAADPIATQNGVDQRLSVPYDTFDASFDMRQSGGQFGSSTFSPFSPDPNYLTEGLKNTILSQPHPQQYPYEPKGYTPWYAPPPQEEKTSSNGSGKVSPTSVGTSRPSSSNQRFGSYLNSDNSGSPFQQNRASSRQEAPIARPDLLKRPSQIVLTSDHGSIQDLNATLASLELDHPQWKPSNDHQWTSTNADAASRAFPASP
ncbi:hypothetical protein EUX98_g2276 [Antrodiella citrinella]|uniref:RRM domain-containing protein n=1 Tax=Antrodiella citrinella TaxID=2447956 RepID=A0A4S4N290_9APHY|nr:hypothetical protein EUX98_g2276 [Antrodiella citrinella]